MHPAGQSSGAGKGLAVDDDDDGDDDDELPYTTQVGGLFAMKVFFSCRKTNQPVRIIQARLL